MQKREIDPLSYSTLINEAFPDGLLVTARADGRTNSMTIGWGSIGILWGEPCFTAYIRKGRFTRELIDKSGVFTVNIPYGDKDKRILGYCGTRSGRDLDKIKELGLTLIESDEIAAPAVKEFPLTLECEVWYRGAFDKDAVPGDILKSIYPGDKDSSHAGANRDLHVIYFGRILKAYIIED